jgi:putative hydrolase of the HAD superfamily
MEVDMFDAVFFDLDDTLIVETADVPNVLARIVARAAASHGLDAIALATTVRSCARERWFALPTIRHAQNVGISSWEGLWADFAGPHPGFKELREIRDEYQLGAWRDALSIHGVVDAALAVGLRDEARASSDAFLRPLPGAREILAELSGRVRLGVITNGIPELQQRKIEALGVGDIFAAVVVSGALGTGKPARAPFDAAVQRLGVPFGRAVMIGNSLRSDIGGANAVGMVSIWLQYGAPDEDVAAAAAARPDHTIAALSDLVEIPAFGLRPSRE